MQHRPAEFGREKSETFIQWRSPLGQAFKVAAASRRSPEFDPKVAAASRRFLESHSKVAVASRRFLEFDTKVAVASRRFLESHSEVAVASRRFLESHSEVAVASNCFSALGRRAKQPLMTKNQSTHPPVVDEWTICRSIRATRSSRAGIALMPIRFCKVSPANECREPLKLCAFYFAQRFSLEALE